jgi:trehalose synthase-fused probable maltokinase
MVRVDVTPLLDSLPSQRWFGGKGRPLRDIEVVDSGVIEDGPPALVLAIVRVRFADDLGDHLYHLPLLVDEGQRARDAFEEVERLAVLGDVMAHGTSIKGDHGVFQFGGPGLDPLSPPGGSSVRSIAAEQSNSSLILDEHIILKLFRKVEAGSNPDLELNRVLTNEGFDNVPPHLGEVVYEGEIAGEESTTEELWTIDLGIAQTFFPEATEGWARALRHLDGFLGEADDLDAREDMRFLTEERAHAFLRSVDDLGDATALLHITLAREEAAPELAPEPIDDFDLERWALRAGQLLTRVLSVDTGAIAASKKAIQDRIDALRVVSDAGAKTRVHGDLHLGQVLNTSRGWMIIDFEGEPARNLDERRAKHSPLRDVAGMLRSFSYAATAALFARTEPESAEWQRLEPWADTWETVARERFLHAYLTRSHEGKFLPTDREALSTMIDAFEIDKALYELAYELSHRPAWTRIPVAGIHKILGRGSDGGRTV